MAFSSKINTSCVVTFLRLDIAQQTPHDDENGLHNVCRPKALLQPLQSSRCKVRQLEHLADQRNGEVQTFRAHVGGIPT